MSTNIIHFVLDERVPMDEVEKTLELARMACEALHGNERVALETATQVDPASRRVSISGSTPPGRDLAAMFLGYVRREFGVAVVRVESRVEGGQHA
jgi:hypothetical protein